jgi:sugar phosphate isomerase/epimerase
MRYAFMSFSTPDLTLKEMLEFAREYGYDGVEPRLDAGHAHGVEVLADVSRRAKLRRTAEASGITIAALASSITYADPAKQEAMIRDTHERIDLAGDLGVPVLRVFGGTLADGLDREQAIALLAESLGAVAGHATERNVTVCIETHDAWCNPAHVVEVCRRVNTPSVAVNWDLMHPVRTGQASIAESFEQLRPWIRHVHAHDGTERNGRLTFLPIGQGDIDHRQAIALLHAAGYPDFISGEWIGWEPPETHLPRELATLKSYEPSGV